MILKTWTTGSGLPHPGEIYMYITIMSSLKPFGKSKPNVMWSILRKGERKEGKTFLKWANGERIYGSENMNHRVYMYITIMSSLKLFAVPIKAKRHVEHFRKGE